MDSNMTGAELKKLRHDHGVSQTDVARYMEYGSAGKPNRSQSARFENGHCGINPRISKLLRFYFQYEC